MLPRLYETIDSLCEVKIRKFIGHNDVSQYGAFVYGSSITIEASVTRRLGALGVVLRICRDRGNDRDFELTLINSDVENDIYSCTLDTREICGNEDCGLFYYELLLIRGEHTLFTSSINNKDFFLSEKEGSRFRLLVFQKDFETPESFGGGVMYQIFTDRFYRGEGDCPVRADAIINEDWENGIPQYANAIGEPLKNNMFFGGNLYGVAEKLDYLVSLGVKYIYLCPIFKAYSNHKYDTGDYNVIDEMFGGEEAFDNLVKKARERGIGIILDGVFNHTGIDSIYFNRFKNYGEGGAYNSPDSPYVNWYKFHNYPDEYESWWGISILPKLNHASPSCREFFTGKGGIVEKYIKRGIAGWRLDVADELSDEFLDELRESAKNASNREAVIIGEVWENAADKVAYGSRRRYFLGKQLDSVMNYPLKNAILSFCLYADGEALYNTLTEIYASYPRVVSDKLMNLLGTHDTERILTMLGKDELDNECRNAFLARKRLTDEQRKRGIRLLKIASVIQYTAYGIPSLYYGDEIGLEGYGDPFCRMPYPWHELDVDYRAEILKHYRTLGKIRADEPAFHNGDFYILSHTSSSVAYFREKGDSRVLVSLNRGQEFFEYVPEGSIYCDLISGEKYRGKVLINKDSARIFKIIGEQK